jgi:hypothetical protein
VTIAAISESTSTPDRCRKRASSPCIIASALPSAALAALRSAVWAAVSSAV